MAKPLISRLQKNTNFDIVEALKGVTKEEAEQYRRIWEADFQNALRKLGKNTHSYDGLFAEALLSFWSEFHYNEKMKKDLLKLFKTWFKAHKELQDGTGVIVKEKVYENNKKHYGALLASKKLKSGDKEIGVYLVTVKKGVTIA